MNEWLLEVNSVKINSGNKTYCFDFTVYFEIVNPTEDIYRHDGSSAFDKGQDEVNFTFAIVRNGLEMNKKTGEWVGVGWDKHYMLAELALDWCRDNPLMHIDATKSIRG